MILVAQMAFGVLTLLDNSHGKENMLVGEGPERAKTLFLVMKYEMVLYPLGGDYHEGPLKIETLSDRGTGEGVFRIPHCSGQRT